MGKLNFKSFGQGEPVIIAHGLFGMLDNWKSFAKKLSEHYLVYIIDLRNHGKSPFENEMNYRVMAEDIKQFMEDEWVYKARVIGHSMGGKVMMQLAREYEDMIEQMVIVDIAPVKYIGDHGNIFDALLSVNLKLAKERKEVQLHIEKYIDDPGVIQFLMKNLSRNKSGGFNWKMNIDVIHKSYQSILDFEPFASPCDVNTLFIKGSNSNYIDSQNINIIEDQFSNSKIEVIDNAGHWVHADQPKILLQSCLDYFISNN